MRIHTIEILPFGMLNAYLIEADSSLVLFDAGLPGFTGKIATKLAELGRNWRDIRAIILSHAHVDHAGGIAEAQRNSSAPVIMHRADLPYLQGTPIPFHPTGPFGRVFLRTGLIRRPSPAFTPDILVDQQFDLAPFGITGQLLHTPGHTPGSLSAQLEGGKVLAGDLAASGILLGGIALRQRPKRPPFEEDPQQAAQSLHRLLADAGKTFYLGHGGPLPALAIRKHAHVLERLG